MIRSSIVPRASSRYTLTGRVCPSRCARSIACVRVTAGSVSERARPQPATHAQHTMSTALPCYHATHLQVAHGVPVVVHKHDNVGADEAQPEAPNARRDERNRDCRARVELGACTQQVTAARPHKQASTVSARRSGDRRSDDRRAHLVRELHSPRRRNVPVDSNVAATNHARTRARRSADARAP